MRALLFKPKRLIQKAARGNSGRLSALVALGLGVAPLVIAAAPVRAFQTTVDFSALPSVSNQTSLTFNGAFGVQATFSNAKARLTGAVKTIDNNSNGICIAKSAPTANSCGRSTLNPNNNTLAILTQGNIDLAFNQQLYLQGFRVGQNTMREISPVTVFGVQVANPGALNFKLNGVQFASFSYSLIPAGGTLYKFPNTVYYKPGDTVTIENTGFNTGILGNKSFYLKSLDVEYSPAPLPVLATATAFGWSRRLRSRVRKAAASAQA